MNKTILCLVLLGIGLTILHIPNVVVHLGIISGLLILTIKLFWAMMQSFSSQGKVQSSGWS